MTAIQKTKNRLIDRILATKNESLLEVFDVIFAIDQPLEIQSLSEDQIEMLMMSEADIASENLISGEKLEILDAKWM